MLTFKLEEQLNSKGLKILSIFLSVFFTILLIFGCSSNKKTAYNTNKVGKVYHDVTGRYNYYFNAKIAYQEALDAIGNSLDEDYGNVLPIYKYGTLEEAQVAFAGLEEVNKKASIDIQLHPTSKWVDDCYLLIGKAQFLKHDYESAITTFQYVTNNYKEGNALHEIKKSGKSKKPKKKKKKRKKKPKKKKKKRKPSKKGKTTVKSVDEDKIDKEAATFFVDDQEYEKDKKGIKHNPVAGEALIWLIKSYVADDQMKNAKQTIAYAEEEVWPGYLASELEAAKGYYFLVNNEMDNGADALKNSLVYAKKRSRKARYNFILAQLLQENGNYDEAIEAYSNVIKKKPEYEMIFYAKLNTAKAMAKSSTDNIADANRYLNKMLKDDKNSEYFDEIYLAQAENALESGDMVAFKSYLEKAVATSTDGGKIKGVAYLKLANASFNDKDFIGAKTFYDSTILFLPTAHEEYETSANRKAILTQLTNQLNTIAIEDSLQTLANLPEDARNAALDNVIDKINSKLNENQNDNINKGEAPIAKGKNVSKGASWYFYNASSREKGFSEFTSIWGKRKLNDDWRRKNKGSFDFGEEGEGDDKNKPLVTKLNPKELSREKLVESLPVTAKQVKASNTKISKALLISGNIYKDELSDLNEAEKSYSRIVRQFKNAIEEPEALYNLYNLYNVQGKTKLANNAKSKLVKKHENSPFAKIVSDPNYIVEYRKSLNKAANFYENTYSLYNKGDYEEVIARKKQADTEFGESDVMPQFALLEAMAIGKVKEIGDYRTALETIIKDYPEHPVKTSATEMLAFIGKQGGKQNGGKKKDGKGKVKEIEGNFTVDNEGKHYVIILFDKLSPTLAKCVNKISNHNQTKYAGKKYKTKYEMLDGESPFIRIFTFANGKAGMDYYKVLTKDPEIFKDFNKSEYKVVVISDNNYKQLFVSKDVEGYEKFFSKNY